MLPFLGHRAWNSSLTSEAVHIVCTAAVRSAQFSCGYIVEVQEGAGSVTVAFRVARDGLEWMLATQLELMQYDWCVACMACMACMLRMGLARPEPLVFPGPGVDAGDAPGAHAVRLVRAVHGWHGLEAAPYSHAVPAALASYSHAVPAVPAP